jgi:hypothetical protein
MTCDAAGCSNIHRYTDGFCHEHRLLAQQQRVASPSVSGSTRSLHSSSSSTPDISAKTLSVVGGTKKNKKQEARQYTGGGRTMPPRPPLRDYLGLDSEGAFSDLARAIRSAELASAAPESAAASGSMEEERLLFTSEVTKTNRKGKQQTRFLVVTTLAVYNFDSIRRLRKPKRRILAAKLEAVLMLEPHPADDAGSARARAVTSTLRGGSSSSSSSSAAAADGSPNAAATAAAAVEVVLQVRREYDYRLQLPNEERREQLVLALQFAHCLRSPEHAADKGVLQLVHGLGTGEAEAVMTSKGAMRRKRNNSAEFGKAALAAALSSSAASVGNITVRGPAGTVGALEDSDAATAAAAAAGGSGGRCGERGLSSAAPRGHHARMHSRAASGSVGSFDFGGSASNLSTGAGLRASAEDLKRGRDMVSLQLQHLGSFVRGVAAGPHGKGGRGALANLCSRLREQQKGEAVAAAAAAAAEAAAVAVEAARILLLPAAEAAEADEGDGSLKKEESPGDEMESDVSLVRLVAAALWDPAARPELLAGLRASPQWASGRSLLENVVLLLAADECEVRHWAVKALWMVTRLAGAGGTAVASAANAVAQASAAIGAIGVDVKPAIDELASTLGINDAAARTATEEGATYPLGEVRETIEKRGGFVGLVLSGLNASAATRQNCAALAIGSSSSSSSSSSSMVGGGESGTADPAAAAAAAAAATAAESDVLYLAPLCRATYSALIEIAIGHITLPTGASAGANENEKGSISNSHNVGDPVETFGKQLAPAGGAAIAALEVVLRGAADERMCVGEPTLNLQRDVVKDVNVLLLRHALNFELFMAVPSWRRLCWALLDGLPDDHEQRSQGQEEVLTYTLNAFASVHRYTFTVDASRFADCANATFAALLAHSAWWYDSVAAARMLIASTIGKVGNTTKGWRGRFERPEWGSLWRLVALVEDFMFYRLVCALDEMEEVREGVVSAAGRCVLRQRVHALAWTPVSKNQDAANIGIHLDPLDASCSDAELAGRMAELLRRLGFPPPAASCTPEDDERLAAEATALAMGGGPCGGTSGADQARASRELAARRKGAATARAFRDYSALFSNLDEAGEEHADEAAVIEKVVAFLERRKRKGVAMGFFTRSKQRTIMRTLKASMVKQQAQVRIRTATMAGSPYGGERAVVTKFDPTSVGVAGAVAGAPSAAPLPPPTSTPLPPIGAEDEVAMLRAPSQRHVLTMSGGQRRDMSRGVHKRASLAAAQLAVQSEDERSSLSSRLSQLDVLGEEVGEAGGGDDTGSAVGASAGGSCCVCREDVVASEMISALGRCWHAEHFACAHCKKPFVSLAEEQESFALAQKAAHEEEGGAPKEGAPSWERRCPAVVGAYATDAALEALPANVSRGSALSEGGAGAPASIAAAGGMATGSPGADGSTSGSSSGSGSDGSGGMTLEFYEHANGVYCRADLVRFFGPGLCAGCLEPLREGDAVLSAIGMRWHPQHFACSRCFDIIAPEQPCFQRNGRPFCATCHSDEFQRCPSCAQLIDEDAATGAPGGSALEALGKLWHREHFVCDYCDNPLADGSFYSGLPLKTHRRRIAAHRADVGLPPSTLEVGKFAGERPFCEDHYIELFLPRCAACFGPLLDGGVDACGSTWHPECFVCTEPGCGRHFPDGCFYEAERPDGLPLPDGKIDKAAAGAAKVAEGDDLVEPPTTVPWCEEHYFERFGKRCAGCDEAIRGDAFYALDKTWHAECFVCADCQEPFEDLQVRELSSFAARSLAPPAHTLTTPPRLALPCWCPCLYYFACLASIPCRAVLSA